jgi:heptosyltransferase-2
MTGRRYLIVKLAALGDVAMASTMIAAIRERDPAAHITWLCGTRVADLVRLFDGVDSVVVADEVALLRGGMAQRARGLLAVWRLLVPHRFDITVLGHADRRYAALLLPVRTGPVHRLEQSPSPRMLPIPGRYFGDEYVRLLDGGARPGPVIGHYELADVRGRLAPARDPERIGIVLAPGGTRNVLREDVLRRWPVERYVGVAAALLAEGHHVTLVGDAADGWVRPYFAGLAVRDEIGAHDVPGTLGVLQAAEVVVVHDTGVLHLARLVRAPVVGLFGPTIPAKSLVEGSDAVALWGGADLACRPCYDGREYARCGDNVCMKGIAVENVVRHAMALAAR